MGITPVALPRMVQDKILSVWMGIPERVLHAGFSS
jgi:hypothetical protein